MDCPDASYSALPISEVACRLGLTGDDLLPYGPHKAKVLLSVLDRLQEKPEGKYIGVTAITPTPLGEGKTVTTIGLGMALNRLGPSAVVCIRQPAMGPVFGVKGGGAGGGRAQLLPFEDINLHFTGDFHAVSAAHNLLAAFTDSHMRHGNALNLDPLTISWGRVLDMNDSALRQIVIGLGGKRNGIPRESHFDTTAASEVMAILALSRDIKDLRERLGRIVVGMTREGRPVTAEDLGCAGSMAAMMKDALHPNLAQTAEGTPAFVHAGPFGNIAHGNSSIVADKVAIKLADYVVTESGFGADLGAEKFFNIKCRYSGLTPDAMVLICTVRAIKAHSGRYRIAAGRPLDPALLEEDMVALREGARNLEKQIENVRQFGVPVVVAVNRFPSDTQAEIAYLCDAGRASGAEASCVSEVWEKGGPGGMALAEAAASAARKGSDFRFLYPLDETIKSKIETIAARIYGADGVDYLPPAEERIRHFTRLGWGNLPICMAKTHLSLSHDEKLKGRPKDFRVTVRDVRASIGAGFIYPLLGEMLTMPGLPSSPKGALIDLDEQGNITGLT